MRLFKDQVVSNLEGISTAVVKHCKSRSLKKSTDADGVDVGVGEKMI